MSDVFSAIGQIEVAVKTFWAKLGENLFDLTGLGYVMANVEVIHNNAYERLIEVLEMEDIFEKNLELEIIQNRVKSIFVNIITSIIKTQRNNMFTHSFFFTLYVENVSLFSQFYTINYFNRFKNVLKDTAQQVAYTSKEELIHAMVESNLLTLYERALELFDEELEELIHKQCIKAYEAGQDYRLVCQWILFRTSKYKSY